MKNTQAGFIVPLIIALIALAAMGGGYYLYKQNSNTTNSSSVNQQLVDASSWATYSSQQYGFSFKYPDSMQVDESSQTDKYGPVESLELAVKYNAAVTTNNRINILVRNKDQINVFKTILGNVKSTKTVELNGISMQIYDSVVNVTYQGKETSSPYETVVFEIGDNAFGISYRSDDPVLAPNFYTILSTFQPI